MIARKAHHCWNCRVRLRYGFSFCWDCWKMDVGGAITAFVIMTILKWFGIL